MQGKHLLLCLSLIVGLLSGCGGGSSSAGGTNPATTASAGSGATPGGAVAGGAAATPTLSPSPASSPAAAASPPPVGASGTAITLPAVVPGGSVSGRLIATNPPTLGKRSANDSPPLGGASLMIKDIQGNVVATGQTNSDGGFAFTNLPNGILTLLVGTTSFEFTSFPYNNVQFGATWTVDRKAAAAKVLSGLPSRDLVLGPLNPLPPGALVFPHGDTTGDAGAQGPQWPPARQVASHGEWFFFDDPTPQLGFPHPVKYVFVDVDTAAVTSLDETQPPRLNYARLWASDLQFMQYAGLDINHLPDQLPAGASAPRPSTEVVQLPATDTLLVGRGQPAAKRRANGKTPPREGMFAILIKAEVGSGYEKDLENMTNFVKSQGVPDDNIKILDTTQELAPRQGGAVASGLRPFPPDDPYEVKLDEVKTAIQARLADGKRSTLLIYITAHDSTQGFSAEYLDGSTIHWTPKALDLADLRETNLRIMCDFCQSENFIADFKGTLSGTPVTDRPDIQIFAACNKDESSVSQSCWEAYVIRAFTLDVSAFTLPQPGGVWTNEVLPGLRIEGNDIVGYDLVGLLDATGHLALDEVANLVTGLITSEEGSLFTHPQLGNFPNDPSYFPGTNLNGSYTISGPGVNGNPPGVTFNSLGGFAFSLVNFRPGTSFNVPCQVTGIDLRTANGTSTARAFLAGSITGSITSDSTADTTLIHGNVIIHVPQSGLDFNHAFSARPSADGKSLVGSFDTLGDQGSFTVALRPIGPSITSVAPTTGRIGDKITINGTHLGGSAASVTFNGVAADVPVGTDDSIVVRVPPLAGSGSVVVKNGGAATAPASFVVDGTPIQPRISGLNPPSGKPGDTIQIVGSDLGTETLSRVFFFSTPTQSAEALIAAGSNGALNVVVPVGAASGPVQVVRTDSPTLATATSTANFVVTPLALAQWTVTFSNRPGSPTIAQVDPYFNSLRALDVLVTFSGGSVISGATNPDAAPFVAVVNANPTVQAIGSFVSNSSPSGIDAIFNFTSSGTGLRFNLSAYLNSGTFLAPGPSGGGVGFSFVSDTNNVVGQGPQTFTGVINPDQTGTATATVGYKSSAAPVPLVIFNQ